MKVIIAGSRNFKDKKYYEIVCKAVIESKFEITEVVSGNAQGIDSWGEVWADSHNIPKKIFRADWNNLGKAAGPIRNQEMADYADALIAIPGDGPGTKDMIKKAKTKGLKVFVYNTGGNDV